MRTTLFTLLMLAYLPLSAQRILEITNSSWLQQNLSVEQYQDMTITGWTEINPSTSLLAPTFKITTPPGLSGPTYHISHPDPIYLMDFTIREGTTPTIILTGMTVASPHRMYIMEINLMTGAFVRASYENLASPGPSVIPHRVILSVAAKQVVVVGTLINGTLTPGNATTVPKSGYVVAVDESNFNTVMFTRTTDLATTAATDFDMLEAIAEVPGGYFITGSTNNVGRQCLYNLGLNFTGGITHSTTYDNSATRWCGASVLYSAASSRVYVLSNSNVRDGYVIAAFAPTTGVLASPFLIHSIAGLPPGIQTNGFCLRLIGGTQVLVGGYITDPGGIAYPTLLTPFNTTLAPTLTTIIASETHQSANNSPLTGYYSEAGFPVLFNTPDIIAYYVPGNASYLVNPSTGMGYDLDISPANTMAICDRPAPIGISTTAFASVGTPLIGTIPLAPAITGLAPFTRTIHPNYICGAPPPTTAMILYPNPATDYIEVQLDGTIAGIVVFGASGADVTGRIKQERTRGSLRLDIGELTPGVYLLSLTDENGNHYHEKFVKE